MLDEITPIILTYNEENNIERVLQQLNWAKCIIVIDSYSNDKTEEIVRSFPNTEFIQNEFQTFAAQCNFGLTHVDTEWVLSLDADHFVTKELVTEISLLTPSSSVSSYFVNFKYCIEGKVLRGAILPPRQSLFRKSKSAYYDDGHAHRLDTTGTTMHLQNYIWHDDRKPLSRWLSAQDKYIKIECQKLLTEKWEALSTIDKLRLFIVVAPFAVFFYCLIIKMGLFDGIYGLYYAFQRMYAELLLSLQLIEAKLLQNANSNFVKLPNESRD